MRSPRRSASHLWGLAMRKLFPRHASLSRKTDSQSSWCGIESSQIDDHTDGFYKYSQELLEQEKREEMRLRSSNSTSDSYESALMAPSDRPSLPYTVSSPDWNIFSPFLKYLEEMGDESASEWLGSVLFVWSRVYTVSKVVVMIFNHYGVELEDTPDSILAHLKHAEDLVTSNSIINLIENTENLYYALYARLIMEIAAVDLCASFAMGFRRPEDSRSFQLPEPRELCKILLVCKQILDDDDMCVDLNGDLIKQHQCEFICRKVDKVRAEGFVLDDLIGYRCRALAIVEEELSDFRQEWSKAAEVYQIPPAEVLTLQSERYLAWTPRWDVVNQAVPALNLPFIDPHTIPPDIWQDEVILNDRQLTLAKLEGKCIGEIRRRDDRRRLLDFVRSRRCICRSLCRCAWECTQDIEHPCPCSERMLSLMVAKRRKNAGPLPFGARCSVLAKAIFEGVGSLRPDANDTVLCAEMDRALLAFAGEIRKQRSAAMSTNGHGAPPFAGMVPRISGTPSAVSSWATPSSSSSSSLLRATSQLPLNLQWIWCPKKTDARRYHRAVWPSYGITTPVPDRCPQFPILRTPFYFQTGYALCAKRTSRPFPPPFLSPPSSSFSDPLTTHYHSQDKRLSVRGELVRGLNNGDDAVLVTENFLGVNDGVGAWATKPRGHAALWSRLILHFWALEIERIPSPDARIDPIEYLQRAYEETTRATSSPGEWFGTTTSVTALLHKSRDGSGTEKPLLYVTNIGDCKVLVIRPSEGKVLFRTEEQWHWFDCPMQLGTNSVDTPRNNAVLSQVDLEEGDIVLAVSDGVLDNLWEHEVLSITLEGLKKWEHGRHDDKDLEWAPPAALAEEKTVFLARELLNAALAVAQDPFAESPYMEKAVEEGLAIQGGKMDDISVVVGVCRRRHSDTGLNRANQQNNKRTAEMRAKRSKKYRKLMHQYELAFGFREPYQVLVDSNLLRAVHSFKMDLMPALERTLQGQVKPLLTKCSLAAIMANQPTNPRTQNTVRPDFLPPPTTLPLRHCSHNEDSTPIDEASCLLSLLSPLSDVKRNKEHYILATADPPTPKDSNSAHETGKKRKRDALDEGAQAIRRAQALRRGARSIPGVPIVYVKRSVMILEPMSTPSEGVREGVEQGKFRVGLNQDPGKKGDGSKKKKKDLKKAKEPNPLSVKKPKKRAADKGGLKKTHNSGDVEARDRSLGDGPEKATEDGEAAPKVKRRRRHNKATKQAEPNEESAAGDRPIASASIDAGED
ncbi:uncharacterized protein BJX67DRAFT_371101 [Aspergillus lucknowensis]|uniref:PPM-type phosphatase domain-containing protein n=1 Tax=Aspergillus lucknowensis TaxID=176173 RepID=A0ABR4LW28_9EURO